MTPLHQFDTAVPGDLEFRRLWLPLKEKAIKKTYFDKLHYTSIYIKDKKSNILALSKPFSKRL
jgi:hypothetical protein